MTKTALITGASRGLGKALAYEFGCAGYRLILHSQTTDFPVIDGSDRIIVKGDLKHPDTVPLLSDVVAETGLDVLINNAGFRVAKPFSEMTCADISGMVDVNMVAPIFLTRALWPALKERKGFVLNVNSLAGRVGSAGESIYSAAKHGLSGFTKALQFDATRDGIQVLSVFIGSMKTDMTKGQPNWEKFIDPYEVAKVIVALCAARKTLRTTEIELCRSNY
jgi:short-subunit dehydrogenase